MEILQNETLASLFDELQAGAPDSSLALEKLADADHRYLRDQKINLLNALNYPNLSKKESYLTAYAVAINEKNDWLQGVFENLALSEGATNAEITEAIALVSLMNVNNVFYRFRHFTNKDYYNQTPAGIKMNIMVNPVLGKEFFELLSLTISALNGCEMCVNAHEESVLKHGGSQARIYDAIRLGAVTKGFIALL